MSILKILTEECLLEYVYSIYYCVLIYYSNIERKRILIMIYATLL